MDCSRFRDDMLDVLYGEADPAAAARFEAHRDLCSNCQGELASFEYVRRDLQVWRADMPAARRRYRYLPGARGLAAAAAIVLAFGGGLSLARTSVSYGDGEVRIAFGGASARPRAASGAGNAEVAQLLARQEAQFRAEIEAIKATMAVPVKSTGNANNDAVLQLVQQMLQQSEARQRTATQTYVNALARDVASQRQADLYMIHTSIAQLDAQTAHDVARLGNATKNILQVNDGK